MEGAREFLDALREKTQVIIISDTFEQFAQPLMHKLGWPTIFCNSLEVGEGGVITRYTGNYSDYLEKRKANEAPAEKAAKKAPSGKPVRQKKLKFSYKEQKEFDTIEDDIADLEQKIADLDTQMAACGSDYVKLQDLTKEQDAAKTALDEKMERWMYLTDLAEKIAAQEK